MRRNLHASAILGSGGRENVCRRVQPPLVLPHDRRGTCMKPAATAAKRHPRFADHFFPGALLSAGRFPCIRQITFDPPPLRERPFRRASPATSPKNLRFSGEASQPFAIIMPQAGVLATQGKRRQRSRFLTAMSKTEVHGAHTPYHGDAHFAPFTPAPAGLNLPTLWLKRKSEPMGL